LIASALQPLLQSSGWVGLLTDVIRPPYNHDFIFPTLSIDEDSRRDINFCINPASIPAWPISYYYFHVTVLGWNRNDTQQKEKHGSLAFRDSASCQWRRTIGFRAI